MNKRIKILRDVNKMTQDEFGKRIGSARNTIANYESGNRVPSNTVIRAICREFDVNEEWLRTGTGEMFIPKTREDAIAELTLDLLKDEPDSFRNRVVTALAKLSMEDWKVLEKLFEDITK